MQTFQQFEILFILCTITLCKSFVPKNIKDFDSSESGDIDGSNFIKEIVHGKKISSKPPYLLFTAPYKLCKHGCDGKSNNLVLAFPLFVGAKAKKAYQSLYKEDFKKIHSLQPNAPFKKSTTRVPYTTCSLQKMPLKSSRITLDLPNGRSTKSRSTATTAITTTSTETVESTTVNNTSNETTTEITTTESVVENDPTTKTPDVTTTEITTTEFKEGSTTIESTTVSSDETPTAVTCPVINPGDCIKAKKSVRYSANSYEYYDFIISHELRDVSKDRSQFNMEDLSYY